MWDREHKGVPSLVNCGWECKLYMFPVVVVVVVVVIFLNLLLTYLASCSFAHFGYHKQ